MERMKRTFVWSAVALSLSLGIVPCVLQAEDDAPPPPPQGRSEGFQGRRGPMRNGFFAQMTEEERGKLMSLVKNVSDAITAYRATPNDKTKTAVQTQVAAFSEYHQQLVIARAEKMIAQAKERLANKDQNAVKQTELLLNPRNEKPKNRQCCRPGHDSFGSQNRKHENPKGPNADPNGGRSSFGRLFMQLLMTDSPMPMPTPDQQPPMR